MRTPKQAKPLKVHGGKFYLKNIIKQLAAPHRIRVFACVGGWAEGWDWIEDNGKVGEIINDLDGWITNFYEVLANPKLSDKLIRMLRATPFSEEQWRASHNTVESNRLEILDKTAAAYHYFLAMRLSMSGRGDSFAPASFCRLRNGMLEQASALFGAVEGLPQASVRLRHVMIRKLHVTKLIKSMDKPGVWFYIDPPYFPDTRVSPDVYRVEMNGPEHVEMLKALGNLKHAKFLLSGYDCPEYQQAKKLYKWKSISIGRPNASSKKREKEEKLETFWANYELPKLR